MDIELSSLTALLMANGLIVVSITIYFVFFYKWDSKTYDDLGENVDGYGGGISNNELFLNEGASQIESLLAKDETTP